MNRIVAERLDVLNSIAEKHGVQRLYLFGSALTDDFIPFASDLDFLVEFKAPALHGRADRYFGLLEDLEELFSMPVDLVERQAIRNPYFQREVEASKCPLYEAA